jgi:Fic family protein/DNA-binding Xre family transcriptional regulator
MLLEKIRIEKNIKIKDLAAKLNIDSSLMSRILSNKRKPSIAQLKILSDFLEIDFNEIMKEYLADEVLGVLKDYPQIAREVLSVAEERIQYLSGNDRFKTIALSKQLMSRLKILDELSKKWKNIKPLNEIQLRKMEEYFFTSYTYESNRIEGNTLTLQETHLVINEGITIGGKSMREHLELVNHREAIDLILDIVQNKIPFNAFRLKQIHQLILKGVDDRNAGIYRCLPVRISGSSHVPPEPYLIEKMMEDYFIFYETQKDILHPVILAAEMHERLVTIHPFIDGNGRTSRLVMNLILLKNGFTIANLKGSYDDRMRYYKALEQVQVNHESISFYELIAENVEESLKEHLHLAGE